MKPIEGIEICCATCKFFREGKTQDDQGFCRKFREEVYPDEGALCDYYEANKDANRNGRIKKLKDSP